MADLICSMGGNEIKLSLNTKEGTKKISSGVTNDVVGTSKIIKVDVLSTILSELIRQLTDIPLKNLSLNILLEPYETIFSFITLGKKIGDNEEQLVKEIKSKLDGEDLDNLYFSYKKIAPFVYQFIGINKKTLDSYLELANKVGVELKSVIPWLILLPKFINKNEPCIFVAGNSQKQIIALSELNGIYFTQTYEREKTGPELQKLVKDLSVYKRQAPITKVYTINYDSLYLQGNYEITPLITSIYPNDEAKGFEMHMIFENILETNENFLETQNNILTFLPIPIVIEKKHTALIYTGAIVSMAFVGLITFGLFHFKNRNTLPANSLAENIREAPVVLSDTNQSTPSQETEKKELNKQDLSFRIENGAGISGIAAQNKIYLEGLGYKIDSIGNADSLRNNTLVKIKDSKKDYKDMVGSDLKNKFDPVFETNLDESAIYDVLLIIGSN